MVLWRLHQGKWIYWAEQGRYTENREQSNHKISLQFLRGEHSGRIVIDKLSLIFAVYQLEFHVPTEDLNF